MIIGNSNLDECEALKRQKEFIPPYCPRIACEHHRGENGKFYSKNGHAKTVKFPYSNQRYICKNCEYQFSYNFFGMDFRKKIPNLHHQICFSRVGGMTVGTIARGHGLCDATILNRISELSRQGLLREIELNLNHKISEPIVMDGFEGFGGSQYDPCNVNTFTGKNSFYTYHINYSPMNRKGRMTKHQKVVNIKLQKKYGKYAPNAIRTQFAAGIGKLLKQSETGWIKLYTDEHKSYRRAIEFDIPRNSIEHHTTSSKKRRDAHNDLFVINHLHLRFRHFLASHRRETVAFNKNEAGLMELANLKCISKNFMLPVFYKKQKKRAELNSSSPAMLAGITDHIMNFNDFFDYRRLPTQFDLDENEKNLFFRKWNCSRRKIAQYSMPKTISRKRY